MKYVDEFYNLHCNPEILDVALPVQNLNKEITESMAMIRLLRKLTLKKSKHQYQIYDFCAGNALTSIIASFLFKNVNCVAVDKRHRERNWKRVKNFRYINSDIIAMESYWVNVIKQFKRYHPTIKTIIISVHPCRELAERVLSIHRETESNYLMLMPCCNGKTAGYSLPEVIVSKIGKYLKWCLYLQNQINGNSKLYIDNNCISPKNAIIMAGL